MPIGRDPGDSPWPNYAVGESPVRFGVDNGSAYGDMSALAVWIGGHVHSVRIQNDATPAEVAKALRELADSIEAG